MTQRLEHDFQLILRDKEDSWYMKIQVNPMAHNKTVGDFLLITKLYNIIYECKQCSTDRIDFKRLTQMNKMIEFKHSVDRNRAEFVICFWKGSKKKSKYAMIPILEMERIINKSVKKSINVKDIHHNYTYTYEELRRKIENVV